MNILCGYFEQHLRRDSSDGAINCLREYHDCAALIMWMHLAIKVDDQLLFTSTALKLVFSKCFRAGCWAFSTLKYSERGHKFV